MPGSRSHVRNPMGDGDGRQVLFPGGLADAFLPGGEVVVMAP